MPLYFVMVPDKEYLVLDEVSAFVGYGRGMFPVIVQFGAAGWTTLLLPKDELYVVPVKAVVPRAERLEVGDTVPIRLVVDS